MNPAKVICHKVVQIRRGKPIKLDGRNDKSVLDVRSIHHVWAEEVLTEQTERNKKSALFGGKEPFPKLTRAKIH